MRLGLGPVFAYEWLRTARNWRVYALRLLFGLGLLIVLAFVAMANSENAQLQQTSAIRAQAEAGMAFSMAIVITQLVLILLVAPAATAGSICLDKQRGTLAHVMVTDLTDSEIVLGKLAARLLPTIGLVLSSLGIMAICTLMGGIDPVGLVGSLLVTLGAAVLAASLALCFSVWAGKTHEVIMATYLVLLIWLLFQPLWLLFAAFGTVGQPPTELGLGNPFHLVVDVQPGAVPLHRHVYFLLACLAISAGLAALAAWRVRSVASRQMNRPARAKKVKIKSGRQKAPATAEVTAPRRRRRLRFWPGPSLDGNPVLWREWHRQRPSRWSRAIWMIFAIASVASTAIGAVIASTGSRRGSQEVTMIFINGLQVAIGLLLLSVSASTALAEERVRGSLDVLMTTPLPTRSIVWGKWWGTFRTVPMLAILPTVLATAAVRFTCRTAPPTVDTSLIWLGIPLILGLTLAYGAALTSFGLAMATWFSRLDRALAATVGAYVFMTVGWFFLILMLLSDNNVVGPGVCSGSPFMGVAYTGLLIIESANSPARPWLAQVGWASFWILFYLSAAAIFMKLTLLTFDRKLGRSPEGGMRQNPTPEIAWTPKPTVKAEEVVGV